MKIGKELVKKLNEKYGESNWTIATIGTEYQIRTNKGMAVGDYLISARTQKELISKASL
jgi:hypothetical protein